MKVLKELKMSNYSMHYSMYSSKVKLWKVMKSYAEIDVMKTFRFIQHLYYDGVSNSFTEYAK